MILSSPAEAIVWGLCELAGLWTYRTNPAQLIREGWPPHYYPPFACHPNPEHSPQRLFLDFNDDWTGPDKAHYAAWRKGRMPGTLLVINRDGLTRILLSAPHEPLGELLMQMACAQEG